MLLGCRCIESATALRVPPTLMTTPHWRPTCVGAVATQGTLAVAALAAHLHRRRRHTGDARRRRIGSPLASAPSPHRGRSPSAPLTAASTSDQPPTAQGAPPASRIFPCCCPATNTPSVPCRARRPPWSQTPDICLTLQPYASQILTFRPFPIKPHEIFIGKG